MLPILYPVIKGLCQGSEQKSLSLDEASSLARYINQPVDRNLKKAVRCVKKLLKSFPTSILRFAFDLAIKSNGVIQRFCWELSIDDAQRNIDYVLDALRVLHLGLFHSKFFLNAVEQMLDVDQNQLGEEEGKLIKLRDNLLNLNNFLERVLLYYSGVSNKLPPTLLKEIKKTTQKIYKVIKKLKSNRLQKVVPDCMIKEEDVLCSVVGLCDEFAEKLRNLDEEMRLHQTDMYFLFCFINERYQSLDAQDVNDTDTDHRVECLQKMGFTKNRSDVIANWIAEQPFPEHKSLLDWAEIYLEDLFKYDIFLNDKVCKFPYNEKREHEWFSVNVKRDEDEDSRVYHVPVINTTTVEEATAKLQEKVENFQPRNPNEKLYFHGTDHVSAKDILESGINLDVGAKHCDFSHGKGFYVADNYQYSLEWSQKNTARAVILFKISDDSLKGKLDLCGCERQADLKSVIGFFRDGAKKKRLLNTKLMKEVKTCKCIIGPISRDGVKNEKWENVQQICLKDEGMADEIGNPSNVAGIVFLNVEDKQLARKA